MEILHLTAKLICVFAFAYAKSRFSHNEAHIFFKCTFTLEGDVCVQQYGQKTYLNTKTKPRSKMPILCSSKANRLVNQVSRASPVIQHRSRLRIFVDVGGTYQIERNKTLLVFLNSSRIVSISKNVRTSLASLKLFHVVTYLRKIMHFKLT